MRDLKEWIENTRELNLDFSALIDYIGNPETCHPELYRKLPGGSSADKADNLIRYYQTEDKQPVEEPVIKKTDLKVLIADGSESKEVIDFLSTWYNVEIFVEDEQDSKRKLSMPRRLPDLVVFTGGEDINPDYYGEAVGSNTVLNIDRDATENLVYHRYHYVPKLGIGRGAQFLTAMRGGRVIQHVTGHDEKHLIITDDGWKFEIESDHHQMMFPYNLYKEKYEILAWCKLFRSSVYLDGKNQQIDLPKNFLEPEIIQFNKQCLCIQGHPETTENTSFKNKCLRYISNFLSTESPKKKVEKEDDYEFTFRANTRSRAEEGIGLSGSIASSNTTYGIKQTDIARRITSIDGRWFSIDTDRATGREISRIDMGPITPIPSRATR